MAFGGDVVINGQVTNLYMHFLGYARGFKVPYIARESGYFDGGFDVSAV